MFTRETPFNRSSVLKSIKSFLHKVQDAFAHWLEQEHSCAPKWVQFVNYLTFKSLPKHISF